VQDDRRPTCVLSDSDYAVYGVTLLNGELFVVRWKQADLVEVYDAAGGFHCVRQMTIVHLQPAYTVHGNPPCFSLGSLNNDRGKKKLFTMLSAQVTKISTV